MILFFNDYSDGAAAADDNDDDVYDYVKSHIKKMW